MTAASIAQPRLLGSVLASKYGSHLFNKVEYEVRIIINNKQEI